ncbi:hypothetical protein U879_12020 [Defluviimonas sp. 20V17]|uniref:Hint domain-containing protein n=1 Tax=Allgaiera indica TaxID=765699 RepID=A0AAN4ZZ01_9RHOB|nr:Hint domain-containing protein [Allgaiera indica]KDB03391.1 hypothetical protein U879_12020 [Defluviimonas sp. 20V17]GHE00267.1 hypothetical protein GCM10008024_11090 [Allgaiera indica]SDW64602.1 Hint domain-containing protein [Allgaiera indica]
MPTQFSPPPQPSEIAQTGGIAAGSIVLTTDGALPVEHLTAGDRIITRDGIRQLRGVSVRCLRRARAVRIGASTLDRDCPEADLLVAPDQKVLVSDWRAKALFGAPRAMVEARRLIDGEFIRAETVETLRVFDLDLGRPAVIYANGLELGLDPAAVSAEA